MEVELITWWFKISMFIISTLLKAIFSIRIYIFFGQISVSLNIYYNNSNLFLCTISVSTLMKIKPRLKCCNDWERQKRRTFLERTFLSCFMCKSWLLQLMELEWWEWGTGFNKKTIFIQLIWMLNLQFLKKLYK